VEGVGPDDIIGLNAHATVNAALDDMFMASSELFDEEEEISVEIPGERPPSLPKRQGWGRGGSDDKSSSICNDDLARQLPDLQSKYNALLRKSSVAERDSEALASEVSKLASALLTKESEADRANATIFSLKSRNSALQGDLDSATAKRDGLEAKLAADPFRSIGRHDSNSASMPEDVSNCSTNSETNVEDILRNKLEESLSNAQLQKDNFLQNLEEVKSDSLRREDMFKKERGEWEERERAARDEAVINRKRILQLEGMCEVLVGQRDRATKRVRELLLGGVGGGGGLIGLSASGDDRGGSSRVGCDSSDDTSDADDDDGRGMKQRRYLNGGNKHRVKKVLDSFKSEMEALATGLIDSKSATAALKAERDVAIEQSSQLQHSAEVLRGQVDSLQCRCNTLYQRILCETFFRSDHDEALRELVNVNIDPEEDYDHFFSSSGSVAGGSVGSMNDENSVLALHPPSQIQICCASASTTCSDRSKNSVSNPNVQSLADARAEEEEGEMLEDLSHALDSINYFDLMMDLGLDD
jgi:hypothetical protein